MSESERSPLMAAVKEFCDALQGHARSALTGEDVANIIQAANAVRDEALTYERCLMDETGWSNPIRHLGRLPAYTSADGYHPPDSSQTGDDVIRVRVTAEYLVEVVDEHLLGNLVEGRGSDRPANVEDAIRYLFESDSWDPWQYPPGRLRFVDADINVSVAE